MGRADIQDTSSVVDPFPRGETGFVVVCVHVYHVCLISLVSCPLDSFHNRAAASGVCIRKYHFRNLSSRWPFSLQMCRPDPFLSQIPKMKSWIDFLTVDVVLVFERKSGAAAGRTSLHQGVAAGHHTLVSVSWAAVAKRTLL